MEPSGAIVIGSESSGSIVAVSESANLMAMIGRLAADPNADIDKMERLMAMKERVEAESARREFNAAMTACQQAMPAIVKNKTNNQTSSRYADLEVINAAITPIYTSHGFSLSFDNEEPRAEGWVRVRCTVRHSAGHVEHFHYDSPIDDKGIGGKPNKTETHGLASATSYARRYITVLIFNLTIKGEDNDGNGGQRKAQTINEQQQSVIVELINKGKADKAAFLHYYDIESIDQLPVCKFQEAKKGLQQKVRVSGGEQ